MNLIDGNQIASQVLDELSERVASLENGKPSVVFVRVGNDPASISYVKKSRKRLSPLGLMRGSKFLMNQSQKIN